MKRYRLLSYGVASALWLLMAPAVFAEAPVVEDSQNFVVNNADNSDADQEPMIHDNESAQDSDNQNNDIQQSAPQQRISEDAVSDNNSDDPALLLSKFNAMQQQIQQLRGQLEVQAHDIKALQQQQQAYYKDLDSRITGQTSQHSNIAKSSPVVSVPAVLPTANATPPSSRTAGGLSSMDEQASYAAAYDLLRNKQFDKAVTAMKTFLQQYPNSDNAVNAHYWLGELYLAKNQSKFAIAEFNIVLQKYPGSLKTDAAMLKLGFAYAQTGDYKQAKQLLTKVEKRFPNTTVAKYAANRLALMKQNGNL